MRKTAAQTNPKQNGKTGRSKRVIRSGLGKPRSRYRRVPQREIRKVVDRIVTAMEPERVILFGSYAYGAPTTDSDIDLLVVMESEERPNLRATRILGLIHDVKTFPMDILVRTPEEIRQRIAIKDLFIREILERGKVLYERKSV